MQLRSMINNIFKKEEPKQFTSFKLLNSFENVFNSNLNIQSDSTFQTCVDIIAKNTAKLRPIHVKNQENKAIKQNSSLSSLLGLRPNEYMSTYDFLYKLVSQLYYYNNAFVYIKAAGTKILGLYVLDFNALELKEADNELFLTFTFMSQKKTVPYSEVIHIRRHFTNHDFYGDSRNQAIKQDLSLLDTAKKSLANAIVNGTKLRGYIQTTGSLKPSDLEEIAENFSSSYLKGNKFDGIAALDNRMEFRQLNTDFNIADCNQLNFCRDNICKYFNLSESIINSKFTEEEWVSFYENVIEPLAVQLSQEFTAKLFTEKEKAAGNEIKFYTNKLEYSSLTSKVNMAQVLMQTGIFTINEFRELFGYESIKDGDKRFVSLNYINSEQQSKYQGGGNDKK